MNNNSTNLDASNQRDLVNEGNTSKMEMTQKDTKHANIMFTSLAQSAIPNLSASKIFANRLSVEYVPDFYYIMDLCQQLFISAKHDKTIKRIETINLYSFTLYVAYALMYAYLETVNEVNSNVPDLFDVLQLMKSAGFNHNILPSIVTHWINALGKFIDNDTKRTFVPYIPPIVNNGDYFDNYFLSANTCHLLPNFRAMFSLIALFSKNSPINLPPNNRTRNVRIGSNFPNIQQLAGTNHARRNLYRIPGLQALTTTIDDNELPLLLNIALQNQNWSSNLHRYLMLDINILRYLKQTTSDLFMHIDTIVYSNASAVGDSLTMIPLILDPTNAIIIQQVNTPAVAAHQNVPAIPPVLINTGFDHASRVKSRTEIVNGNVDYAYQTPLVRIINHEAAVIINNHQYVDPQHVWYTLEHEFQTPVITLSEARAYFRKL